jgi:response regulator RpfG family c-di-GMP phosphodiesterase
MAKKIHYSLIGDSIVSAVRGTYDAVFFPGKGDQEMSMNEVSKRMNDRPEYLEISDEIAALAAASEMAELRDENNKKHIKRVQTFCWALATELQKDTHFFCNAFVHIVPVWSVLRQKSIKIFIVLNFHTV